MRKKIVAGNWKMNTSLTGAKDLVEQILAGLNDDGVEKVLFPPFPFIHEVSKIITGKKNIFVGAQDCSEHEKGAFTGQVSAAMIHSIGGTHVIVGHSERRHFFGETPEQLTGKINQALSSGLTVIYCFGELLEDRKRERHFDTVKQQLTEVLKQFPADKANQLILAYEPVWAIGTGETATPAQAQEMHSFVRNTVGNIFTPQIAGSMPVLYGGSCNAQNAASLFKGNDIDGGLIGGASLKSDDFKKIIASFS